MFFFITLTVFSLCCSTDTRTVHTLSGPVKGNRVDTLDPRTDEPISYDEFLTIPFAEPPLGSNRFAPPKPVQPWKELNNSVPFERVCYQVVHQKFKPFILATKVGGGFGIIPETDEDCLYLNIYVPVTKESSMPVLVWMTGGAFLIGGGIWYGPNFWMAHEIIIVTINYRVGPFGFLTLGVEDAPGNAGLLDQRLALQWVQQNIAEFGGDPEQVTLAGESAGSFSATYHLVSPGSKGLFRRVIGNKQIAIICIEIMKCCNAQDRVEWVALVQVFIIGLHQKALDLAMRLQHF